MIGRNNMSRARQVRMRALGTSAMSLAALLASPAFAQCAPEPTVENGTTVCLGTDADGLVVTTPSTIIVATDATVLKGSAQTGAIALSSSSSLSTIVSLTNNGTISAPGGTALVALNNPARVGFSSITNAAGATISGSGGAMNVWFGSLTNAGTIDGGTGSAIVFPGTDTSVFPSAIVNSGSIVSDGAPATLALTASTPQQFGNSGRIVNAGTGLAIDAGSRSLGLVNASGGVIGSGGPIAIRSTFQVSLINAGTINGSIVGGDGFPDRIDTRAGIVNGSILLNRGDDRLITTIGQNTLVGNVFGTIDGGTGTDLLEVIVGQNHVLTDVTLPTNFEVLQLDLINDATLTLAAQPPAGGYFVRGTGTVVVGTDLTTTAGPAISNNYAQENLGFEELRFVNDRAVTATLTRSFGSAVALSVTTAVNSGTITAINGNGVWFQKASSDLLFTNSGTIVATNTGAIVGGVLQNTGTIRSLTGTAVSNDLGGGGARADTSTNTGVVDGVTAGYALSSLVLVNSGLITASNGVGLAMDGATLDNRVGGIVSGTQAAIQSDGFFENYVANAGTINGNVDFGSASSSSWAQDWFIDRGGTVEGDVRMGGGDDVFVTDLARPSGGVTGTIDGGTGFDIFRYRTSVNAQVAIAPRAMFEGVGYEVAGGAKLTLTSPAALTVPLNFAGTGTIDVTADMTTDATGVGRPLIDASTLPLPQYSGLGDALPGNALLITSRGTLTLTRIDANTYLGAAVALGGNNSFVNAGTIVATDRATLMYSQFAAISGGFASSFDGGTVVTNSGSIILDGTVGISGGRTVTNSGSIVQAPGGRAATGIRTSGSFGATTIVNSGTIDVAGAAVETDYYSAAIDNSGRLASSGTAAITGYANITNRAGGTIVGGAGQAIQTSGGSLTNAGTITGTVDLGYASFGRSFNSATYIADGGTIAGDLRFGEGSDTIIAYTDDVGVSGTIDGGEGFDTFVHARRATGTVTLGRVAPIGFEEEAVQAFGADTTVTIRADAPVATLSLQGNGAIVNTVDVAGDVRIGPNAFFNNPFPVNSTEILSAFTNQGVIGGGSFGETRRFTNSGTIGAATLTTEAVSMNTSSDLVFVNEGRLANDGTRRRTVQLYGWQATSMAATNSGSIEGGGFSAFFTRYEDSYYTDPSIVPMTMSLNNTGTITTGIRNRWAVYMEADINARTTGTVTLTNGGTIDASGESGTGVYLAAYPNAGDLTAAPSLIVANAGTIRANGGGGERLLPNGERSITTARALYLNGSTGSTATVTNAATGLIEATGIRSTAIVAYETTLDLTNAGVIRGTAGTVLAYDDPFTLALGRPFLAGAIRTSGETADRIVNTGAIIGSIDLGAGDDRIENRGRIDGDVFLGTGDDSFLQQASAFMTGTVDGGDGTDSLTVDAAGGGTVDGDRFVRFERFSQIGQGNVTYTGNFRFDTIGQSGGTITVAAGQTLSSDGPTTITGSDAGETVLNDGTITGTVDLGGGGDRVLNRGAIGGSVLLGAGDDAFVDGPNSSVAGAVDGGTGTDTYTVTLAGDRTGIGQRTGFERLGVEGSGTLTLALDQNFEATSLTGVGLNIAMNGFAIGPVTGSDGAERLTTDGDIGSVALGAGDDLLSLGATRAVGSYAGGTGADLLRFTATDPVTLTGTATGFERVQLVGGTLTVAGTLGLAGAPIAFDDAAQIVTVASGGTLAGAIDLGAGNDSFRLSAGGTIAGTVAGNVGNDTATVELAGDRALASATLTGFETLATEGNGTLTLTGTHGYDQVQAATDLAIATDGVLATRQVVFGAGNQRFMIAGRFQGSVSGGAGTDTIAVAGGSATAPVAFTDIATVETLQMTGGYATIAGRATLNNVDMSSGRLVGLAGSTLTAPRIVVGRDATFGSAGIVNGDLAVAGTLSPGASPGTMTVNGNVALASGSVSLFELTPTVSDQLIVNGALSIASGATLQLTATGALRPGTSYDLIVASGGITGSYTTVRKPDTLFGFIVQRADRIQLLGQFLGDPGFSPQVSRSIAYANATLAVQPATSTLFASLPSLLTANGGSNPQAFAQLTPEAYASATQIGVENALAVTDIARGPGFAPDRTTPGGFTFAQGIGSWYRLGGDPAQGVSSARTSSYGFLGGVGYGDRDWSVGAFGGYLNSQQRIDALGARTGADGFVAGAQGRYQASGFGFGASIVYNGAKADTRRALPGAATASGRYDLESWVSDVSIHYTLDVGGDWTLRPRAGVTYLRTTREGIVEAGGPLALTVARDRHVAGFADGGFTFGRSDASDAAFRPFVGLGVRYQLEGRRTDALAGYAGGGLGLEALGAARTRAVGTATAGIVYRLTTGLDLFSTASAQTGRDDHRESISTGVRLRF